MTDLTGAERSPALIAGEWTIVGVNTPYRWVNVCHQSGAVVRLPWEFVMTTDQARVAHEALTVREVSAALDGLD